MDDVAVQELYAEYSSQDLDRLLDRLSDDVDWPDGPRRLAGKDQVRWYWTRQWRRTRTEDRPSRTTRLTEDVLVLRVDQTVRSLDGAVLSTGVFVHVLQTAGPLVRRLDIVDVDRTGGPAVDRPLLEAADRG